MFDVLLWLALVVALVLMATVVSWLKGTLGLVSPAARKATLLAGEPNWWYATGVFGAPLLLFFMAFALAHPESRWARRLYGDRKMERARRRYQLSAMSTTERGR